MMCYVMLQFLSAELYFAHMCTAQQVYFQFFEVVRKMFSTGTSAFTVIRFAIKLLLLKVPRGKSSENPDTAQVTGS